MPPRRQRRDTRYRGTRNWGSASDARARRSVGRWAEGVTPSRRPPQSPKAQARYLRDEVYGGSTRRMAEAFGVRQRTVQRWLDGSRRMPRQAERLAGEVADTRRRRARRRIARGAPPRIRVKGDIGPGRGPGPGEGYSTKRLRTMPDIELDPEQSEALAEAADRNDPDAMRAVLADAYGDYFDTGAAADVGEIQSWDFL